jgi:hypothetical protein
MQKHKAQAVLEDPGCSTCSNKEELLRTKLKGTGNLKENCNNFSIVNNNRMNEWRNRLPHQHHPIPQPKKGSRLSNIDNLGFSSSPSSAYFPRHT